MQNQPLIFAMILFSFSVNALLAQKKTTSLKSTPDDSKEVLFKKSDAMVDYNYMLRWEVLLKPAGEVAPNFTIRHLSGKEFNLYKELEKGDPILLINGSYTCDISREQMDDISDLSRKYKRKLRVYLIHTVEAHPADMASPYSISSDVWISNFNLRDDVAAEQPKTYRDRRILTQKWKNSTKIAPKILVDDPDNEFWNLYGQSPNMAFLIGTDSTISSSQILFDRGPMEDDIGRLLD